MWVWLKCNSQLQSAHCSPRHALRHKLLSSSNYCSPPVPSTYPSVQPPPLSKQEFKVTAKPLSLFSERPFANQWLMSPCPSLWTVKGSSSPKVRQTSSKQVQGTCPTRMKCQVTSILFWEFRICLLWLFFLGGILCFLVLACFLGLYVFGSALFPWVRHLAVFSTENKSEYKI